MNFSGFIAWFLWRSGLRAQAPAAGEEDTRGALLGAGVIFSKALEQMLTLRDVELIWRIATSLRRDVAE
jgi:hypothetical protein